MSSESSPFKVALRDLPAHKHIDVSATYVDGLVRGMPLRDALDEAPGDDGGTAELDLDSDGKSVFVQGTIAGQVTVACSRCVKPAPIRFEEEVRVTYLPASQLPDEDEAETAQDDARARKGGAGKGDAAKGEKAGAERAGKGDKAGAGKDDDAELGLELATDDLDVFPYAGDAVDLEPLVREQFILAVPFAPLCKDDCLGLCPQCGIDKNVESCACEKPIDPRFAALQGLKLPS